MTELAWMQQWYALCDKWRDQGYDALTADEKVWFTIRALIDLTENGGIVGYYCNSGADHVDDCMAALDRLGAHDVRHQVERVNALFGEGLQTFTGETRSSVPGLTMTSGLTSSWTRWITGCSRCFPISRRDWRGFCRTLV